MVFQVIGIGNKKFEPAEQVMHLIRQHQVFSGGQRHYELVKHFLPERHQWISIKGSLERLFESYNNLAQNIVVFASGDPLFYGIANTLKTHYPKANISVYPYFSSIQLLAHRATISSNTLQTVSVHGRSWQELDEIIIRQQPLICVLTDQEKSPAAIASRLLKFGYQNYSMWIGEDLEGSNERVRHLSLPDALQQVFHPLNCVILKKESHRNIPFGVDDSIFEGLEGRPNMITKMPVRLCSLHALELESKAVLWDLGFCTGSLSIEAKLRFPGLEIHAIEKREECIQIIQNNQYALGAPGINVYTGDIYEFDFESISRPQAVFIGGHGGKVDELIHKIDQVIGINGVIVMNAVQTASIDRFISAAKMVGWKMAEPLKLKVNLHNEITILKAVK